MAFWEQLERPLLPSFFAKAQDDKSVFERYNVLITSCVVTLSRKITK